MTRLGLATYVAEIVPWKRLPPGTVRVAGHRIVYRRGRGGEVARFHCKSGHLHYLRDTFGVVGALVAEEVEQPVLLDRPADGGAVLVVDVFRLGLASVCSPLVRLHVLVGMESEERTVDVVGTALDLQGDCGAARQT